jgi:3D (Asp-Asp-Asp) domain-containing protein
MNLLKSLKSNKKVKNIAILAVLSTILTNIAFPGFVSAKSGLISVDSIYLSQNLGLNQAKGPYKMDYFGHDKSVGTLNKQKKLPNMTVNAVITAYTSTVDQTDDDPFVAASGKMVYDGMIAANWLPFGTKVKIPSLFGDKIFTVDDRMNSRYGFGRMDIWLDADREVAVNFGVKRVDIEVYYQNNSVQLGMASE